MLQVVSASFPRSGSSWIRRSLWYYFSRDKIIPSDLGLRSFSPPLIDDISERQQFDFSPVIYKTHKNPGDISEMISHSDKLIVLYRKPFDVFRSKIIKKRKLFAGIADGSIKSTQDFTEEQLQKKIQRFENLTPDMLDIHKQNYIQFYEEYINVSQTIDTLFLCYEELSMDFLSTFSRVISFLEFTPNLEIVNKVKDLTNLSTLKKKLSDVDDRKLLQFDSGTVGKGAEFFKDLNFQPDWISELNDIYNKLIALSQKEVILRS